MKGKRNIIKDRKVNEEIYSLKTRERIWSRAEKIESQGRKKQLKYEGKTPSGGTHKQKGRVCELQRDTLHANL